MTTAVPCAEVDVGMLTAPPEGQNVQSVASVSIRGIVKSLYQLGRFPVERFSCVVQMAGLRVDVGRGQLRIIQRVTTCMEDIFIQGLWCILVWRDS